MRALRAFAAFLREVLSENGQGSWSRVGSAAIVAAYAYTLLATRVVPERTDQVAYLLAALYGANQVKACTQWLASRYVRRPPPEAVGRSSDGRQRRSQARAEPRSNHKGAPESC